MEDYLTLKTPDNFEGRPYGYITNQIGHVYIGFYLLTSYCFVLDKIAGYPNQTTSLVVLVGIYLLWWELLVQGWRSFDTIQDTLYFFSGGASFLFIEMEWVIDRLFLFMTLLWIPLIIGALRRIPEEDD